MYYWIFGLLGLAALGLDQWVKAWTTAHLALGETAPLLPGLVELMRVHNYGAAWSSFSGQKWLLLGVTGVIVLAVAWLLVRKVVRHPAGILACCLIQYSRPAAAGLCGGYAAFPVLAQLSHVQRGGYVYRFRRRFRGGLLCVPL